MTHLRYLAVEGARMDGVDNNILLSMLVKIPLEYPSVGIHCYLHNGKIEIPYQKLGMQRGAICLFHKAGIFFIFDNQPVPD
jgi:hypothetical protein